MANVLIDDIGWESISDDITAKKSDCLQGYFGIFSDSDDEVVEGTLLNTTGQNATYTCNSTTKLYHTITPGYHDGSEVIEVNPVAATTAKASTILNGYKVYLSDGSGSVYLQSGSAGR